SSLSLHPISTSFSVSVYCHSPDLYSFPTRRSSDLPPGAQEIPVLGIVVGDVEPGVPVIVLVGGHQRLLKGEHRHGLAGAGGNVRSEEHTSELQSRFDIVCRLLLEKKNIK